MSRRRRKPDFFDDGVLVVDKPAGPTSHDVVERLRRRFRPAKLGHTGTLDPFATGVLVLAFNRATRMSNMLGSGKKVYAGTVSLGKATDTGDPTGEVTETAPVPQIGPEQAAEALAALEGERQQAPPAYSAAKHQGKPLYAYARQGVAVEKPARAINVGQTKLVAMEPGEIAFELTCSKGTYVRSLAEDLARGLGTVGHLKQLRRLASAPFSLGEALELDEALDLSPQELAGRLIGLSQALERAGLPAVEVDADTAWQLRQGMILPREIFLTPGSGPALGAFMVLTPEGELVAVLRWLEPGERRPGRDYESMRVFPEQDQGELEEQTSASATGAE
ncbi:MAG: tRNA pseudouridine(55) synthase TruB [Desulfarculus sp.]|nr:tRNA pseudouridine(55) synthase TruB [Pseudomonadota bacterium]MBV1717764.1 tRNA pseudouridine(55) synthase TruB [Desulfarculus sp.]MBU4575141.1 tRNA pseudouridine(55) synthase TruB [Pseudomonadota bacterium]MBU4596762.1 tRNA pseudouridine(55) synthase TruB [Pseudomonadota bacterium]MBV1740470.1 tRNA pseudouridine(55) synthase TruB [Desulfarculus sp.]